MCFGYCCFFLYCRSLCHATHFYLRSLSFTILLAPLLRFAAPCSSTSCSPFFHRLLLVYTLSVRSYFLLFHAQFPAHLSLPDKSRCAWPHSACAISLSRLFVSLRSFLPRHESVKGNFFNWSEEIILFMVYFHQIYLEVSRRSYIFASIVVVR